MHAKRVAFVLARPEARVRELARELAVAPSTVTRIRQKHATPNATPAEMPIAAAVAQSEAIMPAAETTVVAADRSAADRSSEHQRQIAGPKSLAKGLAPAPQPRTQPSTWSPRAVALIPDRARDRAFIGAPRFELGTSSPPGCGIRNIRNTARAQGPCRIAMTERPPEGTESRCSWSPEDPDFEGISELPVPLPQSDPADLTCELEREDTSAAS